MINHFNWIFVCVLNDLNWHNIETDERRQPVLVMNSYSEVSTEINSINCVYRSLSLSHDIKFKDTIYNFHETSEFLLNSIRYNHLFDSYFAV